MQSIQPVFDVKQQNIQPDLMSSSKGMLRIKHACVAPAAVAQVLYAYCWQQFAVHGVQHTQQECPPKQAAHHQQLAGNRWQLAGSAQAAGQAKPSPAALSTAISSCYTTCTCHNNAEIHANARLHANVISRRHGMSNDIQHNNAENILHSPGCFALQTHIACMAQHICCSATRAKSETKLDASPPKSANIVMHGISTCKSFHVQVLQCSSKQESKSSRILHVQCVAASCCCAVYTSCPPTPA